MNGYSTAGCKIQCHTACAMARIKPLERPLHFLPCSTSPASCHSCCTCPSKTVGSHQGFWPQNTTFLLHTACLHNEILTRKGKKGAKPMAHTPQPRTSCYWCSYMTHRHLGCNTALSDLMLQTPNKWDKAECHRYCKSVNTFSAPVKLLQTKMFKRNHLTTKHPSAYPRLGQFFSS